MTISLKTHKMLWGKSGNMCAFPECKLPLVADIKETDDPTIIGEEAHIVAQKPNGPRGDINFPQEKVDKYENLILLCSMHHKVIDKNVKEFPKERVVEIKKDHEKWVSENLSIDKKKQMEDELYASYIDEIMNIADINYWTAWTSYLLSADGPHMLQSRYKSLMDLGNYILSRVWPNRYPELENSIHNFLNVLNALIEVFDEHSEIENYKEGDNWLRTRRFYKIPSWNEELYNELLKDYEFHIQLIDDLVFELTRAMNYIFEKVREFIFPTYRLDKGVLLLESGPHMNLKYHTHRVVYKDNEKIDFPFPGLEKFMVDRETRDLNSGSGISDHYQNKFNTGK